MATASRLRQLIATTHAHGLAVKAQIAALARRSLALEKLNAERRQDLAKDQAGAHKATVALVPVVMYDSVDLSQIPADAEAVAGYVGGSWPTFSQLAARWPHAHLLSIAVNASEDADCLDVENGDATPADAPAWVKRQLARGLKRPVVYADMSNMAAVRLALAKAKLASSVRYWVAQYTGNEHLPAGFDACQWTDKADGKNLDESICSPTFFA